MALRLQGASSGYIELKAPASAGDNTLTLPTNNGSANNFLKTDGSGNLSWQSNLTFDGTNLLVNGTMLNAVQLKFGNSGTAYIDHNIVGQDFYFRVGNSSALDTTALVIKSDGKLGIGTTSPDSALHVYKQINDRTARFQRISSQHIDITQTSGINSFLSTGKNFEIGTTDSQDLLFDTNGSERARIDTNGNVTIQDGDLVIGTSGHGIDFSATADASSSASNIYEVLDDYEEGYFTPNIQPVTSGSITWVGTADLLSYTKIGRIVHIKGMLEVDSVSSPTGITRGTLPFAQASLTDESERTSGVCIITGTSIAAGSYALYPNGGTDTYLEPIRIGNSADIERDVSSYLGAGDKLYFSYTYQASA